MSNRIPHSGPRESRPHPGYVDATSEIGASIGRAGGASVEQLLAERARHGIRFSLVRSRSASLGETPAGNRALLDACDRDPGLLPVISLQPERSTNLFGDSALTSRAAAFWFEGRALPGRGGIAADRLARAAAQTGRPLFIQLATYGDASAIGAATVSLGVPVILVGTHYDNAVDALTAADQYPHLHLETSAMAHLGAIETAVGVIGAERLLLGTGAPRRAIRSSLNAIAVARIPADAKRAILAGNAARIFGLPTADVELPEITRPARAIDIHAHTGRMAQDVPDLSDDDVLPEITRQVGAQVAVASNAQAIETDLETGNRRQVDACRASANLLGYLVADPNEIETAREHIHRWGNAPGIVGIKIGCEQSQPTASRAVWELFAVLAEFGRPVKIHNDGPGWDTALLRIAREHPRLPIIVAHGGLGTPSSEGAALTEAAENVYLEMCSSFAQLALAREVVRRVPRQKFMFGTDAPLLEPAFVLGTYQDADIPPEQEGAVYWDNAARLFGVANVAALDGQRPVPG